MRLYLNVPYREKEEGNFQYELVEDDIDPGEELHLAWVEKEEDIPPKLLKYLKENYSVKTGYSKTIGGKCFANHCDCCGALQYIKWYVYTGCQRYVQKAASHCDEEE